MTPALRLNLLIEEKALSLRTTKAIVRKDLAKRLEISEKRLQIIRRADKSKVISPEMLVAMADYFGCGIDDLFNPAIKHMA